MDPALGRFSNENERTEIAASERFVALPAVEFFDGCLQQPSRHYGFIVKTLLKFV